MLDTSFTTDAGGALTSFRLSVPSQPASEYQLERLTTGETDYSPVGAAVPGTGAPLALTDPAPPADTALYRVSESSAGP